MILQNNKEKRTAIILCGGKGTRLGSAGKKNPKTIQTIWQRARKMGEKVRRGKPE